MINYWHWGSMIFMRTGSMSRIATIKSRIKYLCDIFTMKQAVYDPDPRIYSLSLLCIFTNVLF